MAADSLKSPWALATRRLLHHGPLETSRSLDAYTHTHPTPPWRARLPIRDTVAPPQAADGRRRHHCRGGAALRKCIAMGGRSSSPTAGATPDHWGLHLTTWGYSIHGASRHAVGVLRSGECQCLLGLQKRPIERGSSCPITGIVAVAVRVWCSALPVATFGRSGGVGPAYTDRITFSMARPTMCGRPGTALRAVKDGSAMRVFCRVFWPTSIPAGRRVGRHTRYKCD